MSYQGISRVPGAIPRKLPPLLDAWQADRCTGVLTLRLQTLPGCFVSPGTGRLSILEDASGREIVAQRAERRAIEPVLPGSGIKGAVRTLFEILSWSCDPFDRNSGCSRNHCCQACSIFGVSGWNGRIGFSDAVPAAPGAVEAQVRNVPIPYPPHAEKTEGDFRLYDLARASRETTEELAREVYAGIFETRMTFWNLWDEELGRLLLCLGLGLDETTRFSFRVGGVKYDGQGAVLVKPVDLRLVEAPLIRRSLSCDDACARWIDAARNSDWATIFRSQLEQLAALLSKAE